MRTENFIDIYSNIVCKCYRAIYFLLRVHSCEDTLCSQNDRFVFNICDRKETSNNFKLASDLCLWYSISSMQHTHKALAQICQENIGPDTRDSLPLKFLKSYNISISSREYWDERNHGPSLCKFWEEILSIHGMCAVTSNIRNLKGSNICVHFSI